MPRLEAGLGGRLDPRPSTRLEDGLNELAEADGLGLLVLEEDLSGN